MILVRVSYILFLRLSDPNFWHAKEMVSVIHCGQSHFGRKVTSLVSLHLLRMHAFWAGPVAFVVRSICRLHTYYDYHDVQYVLFTSIITYISLMIRFRDQKG